MRRVEDSMSFVKHPEEEMKEQGKELSDFCKKCVKSRLALTDGPVSSATGKPLYLKGDFIVSCKGMPAEDKYIPHEDKVLKKLAAQGEPLTDEQIEELRTNYDLIRWAKKYLGWEPRVSIDGEEYQAMILNCSSKRKVLRCGRRLGKSETLIVWTLYKLYTNSPKASRWDSHTKSWEKGFSTIMFVAPYLSQVKDFFSRLRDFVYNHPELKAEVASDVSTPFFKLELKSGMKVLGFSAGSSGASSLRGQKADYIVLDEMDYLDQDAIDTIMALLMEHNDVEMISASTPSGRREYFYQFCKEKMDFKEFFYPSMCNPSWGPKMEAELRGLYRTEIAWKHEIEAEFGEAATSVFQFKYITDATRRYRLSEEPRKPDCLYAIGCDWNDAENGTKIRVTEWDTRRMVLRSVDHQTVQKAGWTQSAAVDAIVAMNRKWKADYIYVDAGFGAMQTEVLRKFGQQAQFRRDEWAHVDMTLMETKGINFSSKVDVFDPISGLPKKLPMKPYMVEACVRKFEAGSIEISSEDETLIKQLTGYSIAKISATGQPVYEAGPSGDHDLDAFMLSVLAFEIELSQFTNRKYNSAVAISGPMGGGNHYPSEPNEGMISKDLEAQYPSPIPKTPQTRSLGDRGNLSYGFGSIREDRIYSPEAFNNDDRNRYNNNRIGQIKGRTRISRRLR